MIPRTGKILILSGDIDSGKSTLCLHLLERIKTTHLDVKGIISPPGGENGSKSEIKILNVATGEMRNLATLNTTNPQGVYTTRWQFINESLDWGNKILLQSTPCDVLIIDELGPLELERHEGWQGGLTAVDSRNYALAILVVRPRLIRNIKERWQDAEKITVTREKQEEVIDMIMNNIAQAC
jgi:nucleoside-triphosphatase THEP1